MPTAHPPDTPLPNRRIVYAKRPQGMPTLDCFRLEAAAMPEPREGEVLVRNDYVSVDPYIRMRMEEKDSYAPVMKLGELLVGRTVAEVLQSRHADFAPGDRVLGRLGWQDYSAAAAAELQKIDTALAPATAYLGCLGSTGITAWIGLVEIGRVQRGETVLVSAASGAVGSAAGQLARRRGCRVVGIAGGPAKCRTVVGDFRFDACVDYKAPDFVQQLRAALPDGADLYFDNVGGPILDAVLPLMRLNGRIPLCGLVSQYNATEPYGVRHLREIFNRRVTLRGFVLSDHRAAWPAAQELQQAYAAGELVSRETVAEGLENAPQAFLDMLAGGNVGKQIVKLRT